MRTVSSKLQLCDGCASRYRGAPRRLLERKYSPNTKLRAVVEAQTALGLTGNTLHELPDTAPRLVRRIRERKQLQSDQTHHAPVNAWAWDRAASTRSVPSNTHSIRRLKMRVKRALLLTL